ncbi:MAG: phosphohistidine phosphatase [Bacteroidetes bacterium]|nr:MAG: phosphohistidine phosphatase [Bacteroidota bacterium]
MKTLYLIRHAKSSWESSDTNDFDRPLNERGKKNAPEMAKRLVLRKLEIGQFISSPAKRARTTAALFIKEFGRKENEILLVPELYEASAPAFGKVVSQIDASINSAAIFAHNPGISDFANSLTDVRVDNIPTCGIFAVNAIVDDWQQFMNTKRTFLFFDYPKLAGA